MSVERLRLTWVIDTFFFWRDAMLGRSKQYECQCGISVADKRQKTVAVRTLAMYNYRPRPIRLNGVQKTLQCSHWRRASVHALDFMRCRPWNIVQQQTTTTFRTTIRDTAANKMAANWLPHLFSSFVVLCVIKGMYAIIICLYLLLGNLLVC